MKTEFLLLGLLISSLLVPSTSEAEVVLTLTFDDAPSAALCNEVWQEHMLNMYFMETTVDDALPGQCSFGLWTPGEPRLLGARFVVELTYSFSINRVEVTGWNNCGAECSRVFLYDAGNEVAMEYTPHVYAELTTTAVPSGGSIDRIAVSSNDFRLVEIRVYSETASTENATWSAIKTCYQ